MKKISLAHVVEGCMGGVGTFVRNLIDSQARDNEVSSVHLFADPKRLGDMLRGAPADWHLYESSRSPRRLPEVAQSLASRLKKIRPDVLILHSSFPGAYGRLFRDNWASIYCAHGWSFTQNVSALKKAIYRSAERMLGGRCDAVVSVSSSEFAAAVNAGIKPRIHKMIYNGLTHSTPASVTPLQVAGNRINFGFIGRFDQQKGLDLLLRAFDDPRFDRTDLWIIGDVTLDSEVNIPNRQNIHKLGWITNSQMDAHIQCFDALVIPSRWEAFGLVALEGMRNGKAVIATAVGGLPELILDGVNGRLVEAGNVEQLRQVLLGLTKRELQSMGEAGRAIFEARFTWQLCYGHWQQLVREVAVIPSSTRPPEDETWKSLLRLQAELSKASERAKKKGQEIVKSLSLP